MKKKSNKLIFFSLIFSGIFSFFNITAFAASVGSECNTPYDCGTDLVCGTGSVCIDSTESKTGSQSPTPSSANKINYNPQVPFGDTISSDDILNGGGMGKYINNVYKYSVGVVGILATIIIMWGGVRWLTAGGSKEAVDDAKKWISGAVSGLVLILSSYFILNFVNPDLVNFKLITIKPITGGDSSSGTVAGKGVAPEDSGTVDNNKAGDTCAKYGTEKVIDFNKSPKLGLADACNQGNLPRYFDDYAKQYNVDAKLLKALSMGESGCRSIETTDTTTGQTDCGVMQIKAGTNGLSCTYLKDHPDVGIEIAARIMSEHKSLSNPDFIAGYNTGFGEVSVSGKKAALAPSDQKYCGPDVDAYECCLNPGGLYVTQSHVTNVMGYYKGQ